MNNLKITDAELIRQYKGGDERAFAILLDRYQNKVFAKIYSIVRDECIAEDLVQETFIKAIKTIKSGRYNEEGKFIQWVSRVAHNLAIDYFRKAKRYPTNTMDDGYSVLDTIEFSENSYEEDKIKQETHALVKQMINELPHAQKEVLIMRQYDDMSFQEIADATGVSINTALGRMRYALINLRKMLTKSQEAYDQQLYFS